MNQLLRLYLLHGADTVTMTINVSGHFPGDEPPDMDAIQKGAEELGFAPDSEECSIIKIDDSNEVHSNFTKKIDTRRPTWSDYGILIGFVGCLIAVDYICDNFRFPKRPVSHFGMIFLWLFD